MSKILKKLSYLDFPENSRQALQYVASCYSDGSTHHGLSIPGLESASENWAYEVCHEYIYFHSTSRRAAKGFKVAYIIFKKAASLGKVTSHPYDRVLRLSTEENPILTGIKKWQMEYQQNVCNPKSLQAEIDKYMTHYDEEQEREKRLALKQEGVPDEDAWVTELKNFYAFQMRESKRDKIAELRKKFEEDKQRISLTKASRKFHRAKNNL